MNDTERKEKEELLRQQIRKLLQSQDYETLYTIYLFARNIIT